MAHKDWTLDDWEECHFGQTKPLLSCHCLGGYRVWLCLMSGSCWAVSVRDERVMWVYVLGGSHERRPTVGVLRLLLREKERRSMCQQRATASDPTMGAEHWGMKRLNLSSLLGRAYWKCKSKHWVSLREEKGKEIGWWVTQTRFYLWWFYLQRNKWTPCASNCGPSRTESPTCSWCPTVYVWPSRLRYTLCGNLPVSWMP